MLHNWTSSYAMEHVWAVQAEVGPIRIAQKRKCAKEAFWEYWTQTYSTAILLERKTSINVDTVSA